MKEDRIIIRTLQKRSYERLTKRKKVKSTFNRKEITYSR